MSRPRGVHHVAIRVRDLSRVEPFYRDVLGLPVVERWPLHGGAGDRSVWVDAGDGGFLALEAIAPGESPAEATDAEADAETGLFLLALRIDAHERVEWERRLTAAGAVIYHRTAFTLYVRDPEGNRIGLSHHPCDHTAAEGTG